ncbi:MAG: hypothetical protein A3C51_01720 [Omnitrophica bacterium RIFCSPHIGHO2_02_FULL_46_20]|nr:MAG: hypothetical protein A3C51_01720 [Omnitrophica bacterium RIFCSPHIGHO2_02_FULL_46_20]
MYIPEKRLITKIESELKKRMPFLSHWNIRHNKKTGATAPDLLIKTRDSDGHTYCFCVEVKTAGYPQYVRDGIAILKKITKSNPSYYPIVAVPFMGEGGKRICDENNVGYMDFGGNAKITHKGILIYTEGKERPRQASPVNQSIFSPKSARITKLFLSQPREEWRQKDIAARTGLSKGLVSRVIGKMIEAGYVLEKEEKLALTEFDDLFSAWIEAETKRRLRKASYYVWAQNPSKLMASVADRLSNNRIKYAFTQEAGASLVAPFAAFDIVSVYVESLDKFPERSLSAAEADKGFNLTVIEAPDEYIFTKIQDKGGLKVVDNLQLYADLKKNPLRGEKQAGHILALIKRESR